jgi:hypothetical protein
MRAYEFLTEDIIEPSTDPGTMSLWHGGNLDATVKYKAGRTEYGPGLYLVTNYATVQKYAKGSRKLYMITISRGKSTEEVLIPIANVQQFVKSYVIATKRKDVTERMQRLAKDGNNILAQHFINVLVNEDAVKPSNMSAMREFLIQHGCDYQFVRNPFGWGDATMVVLFNMNKIVKTTVVTPKDKVAQYDLPPEFA